MGIFLKSNQTPTPPPEMRQVEDMALAISTMKRSVELYGPSSGNSPWFGLVWQPVAGWLVGWLVFVEIFPKRR